MAKSLTGVDVATDTFLNLVQKVNNAINAISIECLTANTDANGALTVGNTRLNGVFSANVIAVITELRGGNVATAGLLTISSNTNFTGGVVNVAANTTFTGTINAATFTTGNTVVRSNTTFTLVAVTGNTTAKSFTANVDTATFNSNVAVSANLSVTSHIISNGVNVNVVSGNTGTLTNFTTSNLVIGNTQSAYETTNTDGTSAQLIASYGIAYNTGKLLIQANDRNANAFLATELLILHDGGTTYTTEYALLLSNGALGSFTANANATHVRVYMTPAVTNTTVKIFKTLID